jgi:hypothetical protein
VTAGGPSGKLFHTAPDEPGLCRLWIGGMQCSMPGHHQCAEPKGHAGPDKCGGCTYVQERLKAPRKPPVVVMEEDPEEEVADAPVVPQRTLEAFA